LQLHTLGSSTAAIVRLTRPVLTSRGRQFLRASPAIVVGACVALAALSLLAPSAPTTDPWGWIVWGREVLHLQLSTVVPGAPSWKPLPVLVTTPLALAGGSAPTLWLLFARAGALLSLVAAARLSNRLAGPWAAVLAVGGLLLSTSWLRAFAHGYSEPLAIGLLVLAVDQHLSGRPRRALLLGTLVALTRPEALLLVALYGLLEWRRRELHLAWVVAAGVAGAALWIGPDWIGSGDPLHASHVAANVVPTGHAATVQALKGAIRILPWPLSLTALAGTAIALRRGDVGVLAMTAVVGAWGGLLTFLMAFGYPALSRFFVLPAGLWCIVGAVGAVWGLESLPGRPTRLAAAAVLAAVAVVFVPLRVTHLSGEMGDAVERAELESQLATVVERTPPALRACGRPVLPAHLSWMKGAVAWELDVPLRDIRMVRTSAPAYVKLLGDPDGELRSWPSQRGAVRVRSRPNASILLSPFGDARVRMRRRARARLASVAVAGPWRALALRNSCGDAHQPLSRPSVSGSHSGAAPNLTAALGGKR
jgi:hypothetical protein